MTTPAGWYPDPQDSTTLRWFDGSAWTAHTQPTPSAQPPYAGLPADTTTLGAPEVLGSPEPPARRGRLAKGLAVGADGRFLFRVTFR